MRADIHHVRPWYVPAICDRLRQFGPCLRQGKAAAASTRPAERHIADISKVVAYPCGQLRNASGGHNNLLTRVRKMVARSLGGTGARIGYMKRKVVSSARQNTIQK